ncbi:hypothetical protein [Enterobacter hormaechei]
MFKSILASVLVLASANVFAERFECDATIFKRIDGELFKQITFPRAGSIVDQGDKFVFSVKMGVAGASPVLTQTAEKTKWDTRKTGSKTEWFTKANDEYGQYYLYEFQFDQDKKTIYIFDKCKVKDEA